MVLLKDPQTLSEAVQTMKLAVAAQSQNEKDTASIAKSRKSKSADYLVKQIKAESEEDDTEDEASSRQVRFKTNKLPSALKSSKPVSKEKFISLEDLRKVLREERARSPDCSNRSSPR